MRTPGVEQRPEWTKAEDRRETRQKGIQRRGNKRERERRGPGGGRNLRAPPFRMQIQEHLEAKVACKSALCSHLIGARAAAPRANTCFLQPLKNRVAYFSLFFSLSLSLFFFAPFSSPSILSLFSLLLPPKTVSSRYCSLSAHDFGKHRSTRIYFHANRATEWHTVCRQAERFSWQISNRSGLQRVETRERERERITAEAQFIKFFPLAWFETPLPKHRHSSTTTAPTITINSRTCLSGREERGEGKKSASTVKTTNPIPGPRIDHRDD